MVTLNLNLYNTHEMLIIEDILYIKSFDPATILIIYKIESKEFETYHIPNSAYRTLGATYVPSIKKLMFAGFDQNNFNALFYSTSLTKIDANPYIVKDNNINIIMNPIPAINAFSVSAPTVTIQPYIISGSNQIGSTVSFVLNSTNSVDSLAYYNEDTFTQDNIYPFKYYEIQLNLT